MSARLLNAMTSAPVARPAEGPREDVRAFDFGRNHVVYAPASMYAGAADDTEGLARLWGRLAAVPGAPEPVRPDLGASRCALTLVVTRRCNLRCRYCYVDRCGDDMSEATARAAVELLDPAAETWTVNFFGGEPLLNMNAMRAAVGRVCELRVGETQIGVTTNGTLLTPDTARELASWGASLIVSLDGPLDLHNETRGDSWAEAMTGLYAAAGAGLGPRTTLRATFDRAPAGLVDRLEYLNGLCDEGLAAGVAVEPATYGADAPDPAAMAAEYRQASDWYLARLADGRRARFSHYETILRRLLRREPAQTECSAGARYVAVAPDGEIWPCHTLRGAPIGRLPVERGWCPSCAHNETLASRPACLTCWARYLCGGGCPLNHTATTCAWMRLWCSAALYIASCLSAGQAARMARGQEARMA